MTTHPDSLSVTQGECVTVPVENLQDTFESWIASSNYPEIADIALAKLPDGNYKSQITFAAWQAWQGAYNNRICSAAPSAPAASIEATREAMEKHNFDTSEYLDLDAPANCACGRSERHTKTAGCYLAPVSDGEIQRRHERVTADQAVEPTYAYMQLADGLQAHHDRGILLSRIAELEQRVTEQDAWIAKGVLTPSEAAARCPDLHADCWRAVEDRDAECDGLRKALEEAAT